MTTMAGEIGSITTDRATHRLLAGKSRSFFCPLCGMHHASISEEVPSQPIPSSSMRRYFIRDEILTKKTTSPSSSSQKGKKKSLTTKNQGNARRGVSLTALKSSLFKFMVFSLSFTFFFLLNRQIAEHSFNLYLNQS